MQHDKTAVRADEAHPGVGTDAPSQRLPRLIGWFEAVASIATGGAEFGKPDTHPGLLYRQRMEPEGSLPPDPPLVMPIGEAELLLVNAAANADARVWGLPGTQGRWPGGQLRDVPPEAFASVREPAQGVKLLHGTPGGAGPSLRLSPEECWWDLRVESADLQRLSLCCGEDTRGDAAATAAIPADATPMEVAVPPAAAVKPIYTDAGLRIWFQIRVSSWPKDSPLPSEREDLAAAQAHFDRVSRDRFREIRRSVVPANWLKPGPRRAPRG